MNIDYGKITAGVRIVPDLETVEDCNRAIHAEMQKGAGLSPVELQVHFAELSLLYLQRAALWDGVAGRGEQEDAPAELVEAARAAAESDRQIAEGWRDHARLAARR